METSLIVLTCGYVENQRVSWLFFKSHMIFENGISALQNLAAGLLDMYQYDVMRIREKPFSLEQWMNWLCEKHGETNDLWGGEFEEPCTWWPWPSLSEIMNTPRSRILNIAENAEIDITKALIGNELNDQEYQDAIRKFWEKRNVGTRETFAANLDKVKHSDYSYRMW